jgi:hypothetical protein
MSLAVCGGCGRHARGDSCPFCGAALAVTITGTKQRARRSILFAGAAAALVIDCGTTAVPFYGAACPTCDAAASDAAPDVNGLPLYGGPCPGGCLPEAGPDADSGPTDAEPDDGG